MMINEDMDIKKYFYSHHIATDPKRHALCIRIGNHLYRSGILTMNQLCETPEEQLRETRNIGEKSFVVILEERKHYIGWKGEQDKREQERFGEPVK